MAESKGEFDGKTEKLGKNGGPTGIKILSIRGLKHCYLLYFEIALTSMIQVLFFLWQTFKTKSVCLSLRWDFMTYLNYF